MTTELNGRELDLAIARALGYSVRDTWVATRPARARHIEYPQFRYALVNPGGVDVAYDEAEDKAWIHLPSFSYWLNDVMPLCIDIANAHGYKIAITPIGDRANPHCLAEFNSTDTGEPCASAFGDTPAIALARLVLTALETAA